MPKNITEKDYLHHTTRQLQRLAQDLKDTGLTIAELSRRTGMNWDTVYKALNRRPVRFDNAERLRYFCQRWQEEHPQYATGTYAITAEPGVPTGVPKPEPVQPKPATPARGKGGKFVKKTTNPEKK